MTESSQSTTDRASDSPEDSEWEGNRLTGLLLLAAVVSAVSALLYGYDTGIISGALLQIRDDFHTGNTWEQIIAASILLGAIIGALSCSRLSERIGRKKTLIMVSAIFLCGALAAAVSPNPWTLSLSRVVLGFAVGGATQTVGDVPLSGGVWSHRAGQWVQVMRR